MKDVTVYGVNKILGTFAMCSKGPALCTLDNRILKAGFSKRDDNTVKACMGKTGECKKFQLGNTKIKKEDKWFNAVKGVYIIMHRNHPELPCYDITLDGDLIDCDGHIVYSAIAVATARFLIQELNIEISFNQTVALIDSALKLSGENGNASDIITMLNNEPGRFVIFDGLKNTYKILDNPFDNSEYSLLIVDGNVPVSSLKEEALSYEREIANTWHKYYGTFACHYIDFNNRDFKDMLYTFSEDERNICKYLYDEHKATVNIETIIKERDIVSFGKALEKIKYSVADNLEITCPETDWIVKRAYEKNGCMGACCFFEGFCTKAAIIMKKESIPSFMENVEEYDHIFGFKMNVTTVGEN